MRRLFLGVLLGCLLASPSVEAIRVPKPPTITEWTPNAIAQLNGWLDSLWQLTNGRFETDTVTSDPDGVRKGDRGQAILFLGTPNQACFNVDGIRDWDCVNLSS